MDLILKVVLVFLLYIGVDFAISALIVKGICWAFSLTFSWKMAFGVWLIMMILHSVFTPRKGK